MGTKQIQMKYAWLRDTCVCVCVCVCSRARVLRGKGEVTSVGNTDPPIQKIVSQGLGYTIFVARHFYGWGLMISCTMSVQHRLYAWSPRAQATARTMYGSSVSRNTGVGEKGW